MSSVARGKSCVSRDCTKPNYVKRLSFGPTVSNTNVAGTFNDVQELESEATDLLFNDNVRKLSFAAAKKDFVRQWIETHDESVLDPVVDDHEIGLRQSSPILGISVTKRAERSPVLGNSKKRPRGKAGLNCSVATESKIPDFPTSDLSKQDVRVDDVNSGDQTPCRSSSTNTYDAKGNVYSQIKSFHELCSITAENTSTINKSPSLDKSYAYKRRKRKLQEEKDDSTSEDSMWIDTKLDKTLDNTNDVHGRKSELYVPIPRKYPRIEEKCMGNVKNKLSESICILNINPPACSQKKFDIVNSPVSTKSSLNLDTESSNGTEHGECKDKLDISCDSDKTVTNVIEDVDSQDVIPVQQLPNTYTSSLLSASSSTLRGSIASTKDSDKTFYSKAEVIMAKLSFTQTSQNISETPSSSNIMQKTSQADIIISQCTSPLNITTDAMTLSNLDSGRKRKKPKKGTIADRLQSLIAKQISCIRIWRHQMKNTLIDNASMQYVTVQAQACSVHFNRQYLEGFIIEDSHNLLQDYIGTGTFVQTNALGASVKTSYKGIAIMTVPSIIGTIQMRAEGIIRIYPPWEIIDNAKSIISVMYLSIMPTDQANSILITGALSKVKKQWATQDFTCPCIESGNFLTSCKKHKDINKPNPMMQLFKL